MKTKKLHYYVITRKFVILTDTHTRSYEQALAHANRVLPRFIKDDIHQYVIGTSKEIIV